MISKSGSARPGAEERADKSVGSTYEILGSDICVFMLLTVWFRLSRIQKWSRMYTNC
jgi:hypothetical protein